MKKCNGTGLVLKYVKRKITCGKDMSYQYKKSIDKCIGITKIKPDSASLNKGLNPYNAFIYRLCRDFFSVNGYVLGTKI